MFYNLRIRSIEVGAFVTREVQNTTLTSRRFDHKCKHNSTIYTSFNNMQQTKPSGSVWAYLLLGPQHSTIFSMLKGIFLSEAGLKY